MAQLKKYGPALNFYFQALEQGMGEDSLYYFWAELYCKQNAYDSALAINTTALGKKQFENSSVLLIQRYSLFKLLDAEEKASEIKKRILNLEPKEKERKPKFFLYTNILSDFSLLKGREGFNLEDPLTREMLKGTMDPGLRFILPSEKSLRLSLSSSFRINKSDFEEPVGVDNEGHTSVSNSSHFKIGPKISMDNILQKFSAAVGANVERDFTAEENRFSAGLDIAFADPLRSLLSVISYSAITLQNGTLDYQILYLAGTVDKPLGRRVELGFDLNGIWFDKKAAVLKYPANLVYFDEGEYTPPWVPQFYSDPNLNNPIDTSGANSASPFGQLSYASKIIGQNDSVSITAFSIPVSFVKISAGANVKLALGKKWKLRWGIESGLYHYLDKYSSNSVPASELGSILAYSPSTGNFYALPALESGDYSNGIFDPSNYSGKSEAVSLSIKEMKFSMGFLKNSDKLGKLQFDIYAEGQWTSLPENAIITAVPWKVGLNFGWAATFTNNKK